MTGIETLKQQTFPTDGIFSIKDAADIVSSYGREGDTYIVHAAEGETVIPMEVLESNPRMKKMIFKQMREMGLEPERYVVGNELNSINPETGQPEFFLKEIFSGLKDVVKKVAPIALAVTMPWMLPAMPMALSAGLGSFAGNIVGGASPEDALKSALLTGATAGIGSYLGPSGKFLGSKNANFPGYQASNQMYPGGEVIRPQSLAGGPNVSSATAMADSSLVPPQTFSQSVKAGIGGLKDKLVGDESFYAKHLSPSRAGLPADAGFMKKFGPLMGTTFGGLAIGDMLAEKDVHKDEELPDIQSGRELYEGNKGYYGFDPALFYGDNPFYMKANVGGLAVGPGTETSDSIPALISNNEFIHTAKAVRGAGKGDVNKGAKKMYAMMKQFEKDAEKAGVA